MANKKQPKNAGPARKSAKQTQSRPRSNQGGTAPKRKQPSSPAQPKKKSAAESSEALSPSAMLWKLSLLLCTALIIVALLIASVKGGSVLNGVDPNATPAPPSAPVSSVDPNQTVTGSSITPPPPSATPVPTPDPANAGGMFINGQPVG